MKNLIFQIKGIDIFGKNPAQRGLRGKRISLFFES